MSRLDDIPEPWRTAMEKAGVYSLSALAQKTGTGVSTLSDLIYGRRLSSEKTIQAAANALRIKVTTTREWAATARGEEGPFQLPAEANRLTRRQRAAVRAIVSAMLDPGEEQPADTGGQLVDLARPPQPDLSRVAARRGESEGRRLREEQDRNGD